MLGIVFQNVVMQIDVMLMLSQGSLTEGEGSVQLTSLYYLV
jgi:hypothetical protein